MDYNNLKSEAEKIFSSDELNAVEKMRGIDKLVKPNLQIKNPVAYRQGDAVADPKKPYGDDEEKEGVGEIAVHSCIHTDEPLIFCIFCTFTWLDRCPCTSIGVPCDPVA